MMQRRKKIISRKLIHEIIDEKGQDPEPKWRGWPWLVTGVSIDCNSNTGIGYGINAHTWVDLLVRRCVNSYLIAYTFSMHYYKLRIK